MSKRYGKFEFKQQAPTKKPRLDIEIISSQQYAANQRNKPPSTVITKSTTNDHLWGDEDEDDEFIILASQAGEDVFLTQQTPSTSTFDASYGKFSREVEASTQKPTTSAAKEKYDYLLQDEDDRIFSEPLYEENYDGIGKQMDDYFNNNSDDFDEIQLKQPDPQQEQKKDPEFKVPVTRQVSNGSTSAKSSFEPKFVITPQQQKVSLEAQQNAAKKKDNAKDAKVKYLTKQLEAINSKSERLQKDYNEINEKIQTKDGEVSMLRYELKTVKQINENLRLEKIRESENMKKEWLEKMQELEKLIRSQQSEIEFKNIEIINIKSKKMNNSIKIVVKESKPKKNRKFLFKCTDFNIDLDDGTNKIEIHPNIFEISVEDISKYNNLNKISNFTKTDTILSQYLNDIQAYLSQLQILKFQPDLDDEFVDRIFQTSKKVIVEIEKYVNQIDFLKYNDFDLNPTLEYDFLCENFAKANIKGDASVYQKSSIFNGEKALIQRRIISALSVICQYSAKYCSKFMLEVIYNEKKRTLMEILVGVLDKIGYSKELYQHFGVVAASAMFLNSVGKHFNGNINVESRLLSLLKAIVYCRPDNRLCLKELSEFLLRTASSNKTISLIDQLCWKSPPNCFVLNENHKILQFSNRSCILQIYASLLEVCTAHHKSITKIELKYLVEITLNTINFLRVCLKHPTQWIQHFTVNENMTKTCECYIRMSNSFIVLLHLMLSNWMMCPMNIDLKTIHNVTQAGVLLLVDIFHLNYRKEILDVGGNPIKSRLRNMYDWLQQHQNQFKFEAAHRTALKMIDLRLIIDEPLKSYDDVKTEDVGLDQSELPLSDFYTWNRIAPIDCDDMFD